MINKLKELLKQWVSKKEIQNQLNISTKKRIRLENIIINNNNLMNKNKNKNNWLETLNEDVKEVKKFEIIWNKYRLTHKTLKKHYDISIKTIDNIFKDYSKHWNNLSWEEILKKYKLKPEVFLLIKSKLRLYKASDVISPYTFENSTEETIEFKIEEAIDESLSRHKDKFIETYERKFKKIANIAIAQQWNNEYKWKMLEKAISSMKIKSPKYKKAKTKKEDGRIWLATWDWHIWKTWTKQVLERIWHFKDYVLNCKEKNITIYFTWDILESLADDWMHPWQIKNNDWPFWYEGLNKALNIVIDIVESISKQWKNIEWIWVPDNHVRTSKSHQDDPDRLWHMVFHRMLELYFRNNNRVTITYSKEKRIEKVINWVLMIMHHWDDRASSKKPSDILTTIPFEKMTKHTVILYWHLHSAKITNPHKWVQVIIVPALAWPWTYSENNKWTSYTWFVKIKINKFWIPQPTIIYLD